MMRERRKSARTSSGVALVATSKSLGCQPEQQVAHRAADDERGEAVAPAASAVTCSAHGLMRSRAMPCARTG